MRDIELIPGQVLSWPHEVDLLNARSWHARWEGTDILALRDLIERQMPATLTFHTSGSTGEPTPWTMRPTQMLSEMLALADVLGTQPYDGVLAFAPPRHRYGAHCSLLLPAVLGCTAWVRPRSVGPLPELTGGNWLIVAIPSTFDILRGRLEWLRGADRLTILHSSARLPDSAHRLLEDLPDLDASLVELLGSTESGAVATRRHPFDDPSWSLVPGVSFADGPDIAGEQTLAVTSPWLAQDEHRDEDRQVHRMDDLIERTGERSFRHVARAGRMVKINGQRHHLDQVQSLYERELRGHEIACIGVADTVAGEHFELFIVDPGRGTERLATQIRNAISGVGLRPRQVRVVPELRKSSTGKVLSMQPNEREDQS